MSRIVDALSTGTDSSPESAGLPWCRARRVVVSLSTQASVAHLFTTGNGCVAYLVLGDRDSKRQRDANAEVLRLRRAMAAADPDRGGTNEEFIAARERYERALRKAS